VCVIVPGGRQRLLGQRLGERRLAGAVAADQPDAVAGLHAEGDALEQQAGARRAARRPGR
jgi:hypothetical protein